MSTAAPTGPRPSQDRRASDGSRSGSAVSTKQIAWAAVNGRCVTFTTSVGEFSGYVIGMDDYHWVVADPDGGGTHFKTRLIHKGLAPVVTVTDKTLDQEIEPVASAVTLAGSSFWALCRKNHSL